MPWRVCGDAASCPPDRELRMLARSSAARAVVEFGTSAGNRLRIRISGGASMSLVPPESDIEIALDTGGSSTLHMPAGW